MTDLFTPSIGEPVSIMIGTYSAWTISDSFDQNLFSLKYVFSQGQNSVELEGVATSDGWTFTADDQFTSRLRHGRNTVDLMVTRIEDGQSILLRSLTIQCFSNSVDRRSHAQVMVDKIESILAGRADSDVESYSIKSRSITKMSVSELTEWREYYLAELGRSADPVTGKRSSRNTVKVGFV